MACGHFENAICQIYDRKTQLEEVPVITNKVKYTFKVNGTEARSWAKLRGKKVCKNPYPTHEAAHPGDCSRMSPDVY